MSYFLSIDANKYPFLSANEELSLFLDYYENGNIESAHKLVHSYLRYVAKISREYIRYGVPLEDLFQEGSIGLMYAVKRFDPHKGVRLATYACLWIRASIQDFILKSWSIVKLPYKFRRYLFGKQRDVERSITEIDSLSSDLSLNYSDEGCDEAINLLQDYRPNPEQGVLREEGLKLNKERVELALSRLSTREKDIILSRYMKEIPDTLDKLGRDYGVTRERVRQIESLAMSKMRLALNHNS